MIDDTSRRSSTDRRRNDADDDYELRYRMGDLGVTMRQIKVALVRPGAMVVGRHRARHA